MSTYFSHQLRVKNMCTVFFKIEMILANNILEVCIHSDLALQPNSGLFNRDERVLMVILRSWGRLQQENKMSKDIFVK